MKKLLLPTLCCLLMLAACKKDPSLNTEPVVLKGTDEQLSDQEQVTLTEEQSYKCFYQYHNYCGTTTTVDLRSSTYGKVGDIDIANNGQFLFVTFNTQGSSWQLSSLQLFAGDCNNLPLNNQGCPNLNQFTRKISFCGYYYPNKYTVTIPINSLPQCFCISARATVVKRIGWGICGSSTVWAQGAAVGTGNNAGTRINYCKQSCNGGGNTDPGCGYRAPYWFNGGNNWPTSSFTVAGYTYTQTEGFELGYYQNNVQYSEALYAYFQLASVRLSGNSIGSTAPIWADVAIVEAWLQGKGKITTTNLPAVPAAVMTAANNIEQWLDANDCDFTS